MKSPTGRAVKREQVSQLKVEPHSENQNESTPDENPASEENIAIEIKPPNTEIKVVLPEPPKPNLSLNSPTPGTSSSNVDWVKVELVHSVKPAVGGPPALVNIAKVEGPGVISGAYQPIVDVTNQPAPTVPDVVADPFASRLAHNGVFMARVQLPGLSGRLHMITRDNCLDDCVPREEQDRIWAREYIHLPTLLGDGSEETVWELVVDPETDELTFKKTWQDITSISRWTRAFRRYMIIYAQKWPTEFPGLLKHEEIVADLAEEGANWCAYDKKFRKRHAHGHIEFGQIDPMMFMGSAKSGLWKERRLRVHLISYLQQQGFTAFPDTDEEFTAFSTLSTLHGETSSNTTPTDSPVTGLLPDDVQNKIWAREYVHLPNIFKDVSTLSSWTHAFHRYMGVYARKWPARIPGLVTHVEKVTKLAEKDCDWRMYDQMFRKLRAFGHLEFGLVDLSLYSNCQTDDSGSDSESEEDVREGRRARHPTGYCFRYHDGGRCRGCRFRHYCYRCGRGHPVFRCRRD